MIRCRVVALVPFALLLGACAAKSPARSAEASTESPASQASQPMAPSPTAGPQGYPQQGQYPAQPAQPAQGGYPTTPPAATTQYAESPSRQAAREFDTYERQLMVAAADCATACKALGSMDRSAGRICNLSSTNDDQLRCTDAKDKVVSARTKVKGTCGSCPETSTDPKDPVPSR